MCQYCRPYSISQADRSGKIIAVRFHRFKYPDAHVAPARKLDPGERFDWARLSRAGIGLWPMNVPWIDPLPDDSALLEQFSLFGYGTEDATLEEIVTAFQRHFRPSSVTGRVDGETAGILARLIGRLDQALARS